jgi:hypothetical protein
LIKRNNYKITRITNEQVARIHITNEIALVFLLTNFHHMDLYEQCTEIEWIESEMNIALKKEETG